MRIKEIYRGNTPPRDTDSVWIRGKEILLFTNEGWVNVNESTVVDTELDPESNHPIANSAVASSLDDLEEAINETLGQAETQLSETSDNLIKNKAVYNQYMNEDDTDEVLVIIDPSKEREIYAKKYVTLTLKSAGKLYKPSYSGTNAKLYYSMDDGNTWTLFTTTVDNIPSGTKVLLKGENITKFTTRLYTYDTVFDLSGNILSLFYGDNFRSATNLPGSYACENLFSQTKVEDASKLILPEAAVPEYGYHATFKWCNTMTQAPILPATTVGDRGYCEMFSMCSVLTTAPIIEATSLGKSACSQMFYNCTHLVNAPVLKATFNTGPITSYEGVYSHMFEGCSALVKAPDLISTVIPEYGYDSMFKNCTSLNYIKCLATNNTWQAATSYWVFGVAQYGTFVKASEVNWNTGLSGIPEYWTVESA